MPCRLAEEFCRGEEVRRLQPRADVLPSLFPTNGDEESAIIYRRLPPQADDFRLPL